MANLFSLYRSSPEKNASISLAIGNRVGHEAEKITYRYAHLFPSVQIEMANRLDMERDSRGGENDVRESNGQTGTVEK